MAKAAIALIGGTGAEGRGLALRFAASGHPVIIGSRQRDRAQAAAESVNAAVGREAAAGAENEEAARSGDLAVLTIPFNAMAETLAPLAAALAGKVVVSTIVPMAFAGGNPRPLSVPEGSAAQGAQALLPDAEVVAGFHHLSATTLADLSVPLDADILICGDIPEAKAMVLDLANELPGARGIDAGLLDGAGVIEHFTVALLRINRRYRAHAAVRITHLPETGRHVPGKA